MKISQREARRLRLHVQRLTRQLDRERHRWSSDWGDGWVNIETISVEASTYAKVNTARLLKHAIIVLPTENSCLRFYADLLAPPEKEGPQ